MKVLGLVFIVIIMSLQYRIWFGDGSVREIEQLSQKISEQQEQNLLLETQNKLLKQEITSLRKNPQLLEEIAREKLGLIKPDETFYRIIPSETTP